MRLILWRPVALASVLATLIGVASAVAQSSVTLAWDPSPGSTIVGYRLYQGTASRTYTTVLDVGNTNVATASNLLAAATYFFAVTAYDILGLESTFSDEVSYTVPPVVPSGPSLQISGAQEPLLTGSGIPGYIYEVQMSADLQNWNIIGIIVPDPTGQLTFTAPALGNRPAAFFRLQQFSP